MTTKVGHGSLSGWGAPVFLRIFARPGPRMISRRLLQSLLCRRMFLLIFVACVAATVAYGQATIVTDTIISPAITTVHAGDTVQFSVSKNGAPATNGYWTSSGAGWIGNTGFYSAPATMPTPSGATIVYFMGPTMAQLQIAITNPRPQPAAISVSSFTQVSTPMQITGKGFMPTSVITVQGHVMPTTYITDGRLATTAVLTNPKTGPVSVVVTNPNPGSSSATMTVPAVFPTMSVISPSKATGGWVTFTVTGSGYTPSSAVMLDGRPLKTTFKSATSLTAYGYLPPWHAGTTASITVVPEAGSVATAAKTITLIKPATSYDVAARFATQAAFGPRPGLVEHIQQVGLLGFLNEQIKLPGVTYV